MSRPLRIELPDAIYHVTSRGDRREVIYRDDTDRKAHLGILAKALQRFDARALAYCLMGNHYHLVLQTRQANLSRLMRHLNGVYTQAFNRRHGLVGHLFQGRYHAILVDRDAYLLSLCRYVERNPVAAHWVGMPADWAWSSFRAHTGLDPSPPWLDTDGIHTHVLGRAVQGSADRLAAINAYAASANEARSSDARFWHEGLRGQLFLGDDDFMRRMLDRAPVDALKEVEIPRTQRHPPSSQTWKDFMQRTEGKRNKAVVIAFREGAYTMTALARLADLSVSHVGRLIAAAEANEVKGET